MVLAFLFSKTFKKRAIYLDFSPYIIRMLTGGFFIVRKITEYRIQEYLDEHNMAFFVKMGVPDAPSIIELKMLPLIDFDNAFPLAAAEKRPPSDMEIRQFAVEDLAAVLRQNLLCRSTKKMDV